MTISTAWSAPRRLACAIAITTATLPLSSPVALAADMAVAPRPAGVAISPWTGFYIGVHGGGGRGVTGIEDPDFNITYTHLDIVTRGWLAGAQVGADWQFGSLVVGGQLDAAWASLAGNGLGDVASPIAPVAVEIRALATGTGRAGYAIGNFLGYAKGGLAWANIQITPAAGTINPLEVNHQRTGWTVGAGLEMLVLGNLSALLEYDFIDFGPGSVSLGTLRTPSIVNHQLHLLKFGLNLRFNDGPVAARY